MWVHIADVAAHVRPGSHVDREAFRRATSVYVPGLVEPMLPEALSNQACSLVPHQDRLAVTVEMDFEGARVRRTAFHRSIIRSDRRLTYPEVDDLFAGAAPVEEPLAAAREVAAALADARRGALAVESSEPEFDFSREGHVTRQVASEQTESHRLIEHLMIAANEAVATLLETRKLPALFRVHERPEPARVERLVEQLASLDVPTPPLPQAMTPQQAGDAVAEISRLVAEEVHRRGHGGAALTSLVLRSLKQAHYSPRNLGHAGLRSPRYCHFTSPIRRYPDLVCHRSLLHAIGAGEDQPAASRLDEEAEWCSQRERDAMRIERDADSVARCFLLEAELFQNGWDTVYEGEVTGVIGAGAFVAFAGYEGMLPVRRLVGDWWELNELETMLIGAGSGERIRLGDPVTVRVEKVDCAAGTRRPRASLMSAHSAQIASGIRPARIRRAKTWQPRQIANTDSSVAATSSIATSTPAAVVAPASHRIVAAVVIAAPMPCAKRLGGPGTYFGSTGRDLHREARQRAQSRPGQDAGPEAVGERNQQPVGAGRQNDGCQ